MENTSQPINDAASSEWPLTYGRGLLQVGHLLHLLPLFRMHLAFDDLVSQTQQCGTTILIRVPVTLQQIITPARMMSDTERPLLLAGAQGI